VRPQNFPIVAQPQPEPNDGKFFNLNQELSYQFKILTIRFLLEDFFSTFLNEKNGNFDQSREQPGKVR